MDYCDDHLDLFNEGIHMAEHIWEPSQVKENGIAVGRRHTGALMRLMSPAPVLSINLNGKPWAIRTPALAATLTATLAATLRAFAMTARMAGSAA